MTLTTRLQHHFMRLALAFVLGCAVSQVMGVEPLSFEEAKRLFPPSEALLLDRNGELIHELRVELSERRLPWVNLQDVSPAVINAILRAEDRRFYEHSGVDWAALGDAAIDTLFRGTPRGASTLSMQVAAMLEPALRAQGAKRTIAQKWDQINAARDLELRWSKRQILEAYLNLSVFRGELVGVNAAARGIFRKDVGAIDDREGAILAALLRGPNALSNVVGKRACALLKNESCVEVEALAEKSLPNAARFEARAGLTPHVARELLSKDARRVTSTIDAQIQRIAISAVRAQIDQLKGRNVSYAAAVVLDNATGEILAYVGNQGAGASAPFVDGVKAARQAGSTLKPLLYATAIEDKLLTAASLLEDSPANLVTPSGLYVPQNYDNEFRGWVSVRTGLSGSLNVPAVRTLMLLGTERFAERLRELGFQGVQESGDYYGFALALGSAEVTLLELANAYRTLSNGGYASRTRLLPGATPKAMRVIDPAASFIVTDIMADRGARSVTFGLENPLSTRSWSAVKTGTSKDMRDNWCVGFSRRYTVAVWVGNFDGEPMRDVSGITGAAPAWLEIMNALHKGDVKPTPGPRPSDVVMQKVQFFPEVEAARDELFIRGTELTEVRIKPPSDGMARIAYPSDGEIIAIDPDVPKGAEWVRFVATQSDDTLEWRLNGAPVPRENQSARWAPLVGRHSLTLHDSSGKELHHIRFEVRGAKLATR